VESLGERDQFFHAFVVHAVIVKYSGDNISGTPELGGNIMERL
jgi:hypothetical protein